MALFLGITSLMAWTALAAPRFQLNHAHPIPRTTLLSDDSTNPLQNRDVPSPPPGVPPPPILSIGGARPLNPIGQPEGREIQERNELEVPAVPTPSVPLVLANGGVRTLVPVDGAVARIPEQTPEPPFIPPPPILPNGGVRPLQPLDHAVEKHVEALPTRAGSFISKPTFTTVYASPGGPAIPITAQRQLVTTYIPATSCAPTPSAEPSLLRNATTPSSFSSSPPSCTTSLSSTVTAVCATSLTPLAAPPIPITDCEQYITYSSQFGYALIPQPTSASVNGGPPRFVEAVQTLTTYYAAPWDSVVPGATPTAGVEIVCSGAGECQTSAFTPSSITVTTTPTPTANAAGLEGNTEGREEPSNSITTTIEIYITETVPRDAIRTAEAS